MRIGLERKEDALKEETTMQAIEAREERRQRRRDANPEKLFQPGEEKNRAARRLAYRNRMTVESLNLMRKRGFIQPGERRIDADKVAAFIKALKKELSTE